MEIKEVSADSPGTTKFYQIDEKDVVDIGGLFRASEEFKPENVEKIALTCAWTEHSENLDAISDPDKIFSKIQNPTVYCPYPEELFHGQKEWVETVEDGDVIELSGYRFEAIVIDLGKKEAMFYHSKKKILFCGDVPHILENTDSISEETKNRLEEVKNLNLNEVYPAIVTGGKEMSDYNQEYIRVMIDSVQEK